MPGWEKTRLLYVMPVGLRLLLTTCGHISASERKGERCSDTFLRPSSAETMSG